MSETLFREENRRARLSLARCFHRLAEQGALSLEDFAAEHIDPVLRALSGNATLESLFGSSAHEVTIAMLLGMRSGVADFDVLSFDARVLATADRTHPPSEFLEYAATVEARRARRTVSVPFLYKHKFFKKVREFCRV